MLDLNYVNARTFNSAKEMIDFIIGFAELPERARWELQIIGKTCEIPVTPEGEAFEFMLDAYDGYYLLPIYTVINRTQKGKSNYYNYWIDTLEKTMTDYLWEQESICHEGHLYDWPEHLNRQSDKIAYELLSVIDDMIDSRDLSLEDLIRILKDIRENLRKGLDDIWEWVLSQE